jgi:hypothetical protein
MAKQLFTPFLPLLESYKLTINHGNTKADGFINPSRNQIDQIASQDSREIIGSDKQRIKVGMARGIVLPNKEILVFGSKNLVHDDAIQSFNAFADKAKLPRIEEDESNIFRIMLFVDAEHNLIISPSTDEMKSLKGLDSFFQSLKKGNGAVEVVPSQDLAVERGML